MVSALDSGASGRGSSPGRRHCVVFLGKKLYSELTVPLATEGLLKFHPVKEPRISSKSANSQKIHKNMKITVKFPRNLNKYMRQ